MDVAFGVLVPLFGTTAGAASVFFLRKQMRADIQRLFTGLAAGVMVAASIWSLLMPAMEMSEHMGKLSFVPALVGFVLGILFLMAMDGVITRMQVGKDFLGKNTMLMFAITLHNFPEGAACGAVFAGVMSGETSVTMAEAMALALGVAIQNFPEGAIISLPLCSEGRGRFRSFLWGAASGLVEPVGAVLTILLASLITPILPYMLAFAAGAMIYVVVEELIPEASMGTKSKVGTIAFMIGFSLMMVLDVTLG